ncbi:SDR family oxidoreductase [Rhodococcus sp. WS4]|nr:SDR family oxidoreductase [Rhodococcus sp. WS4]
MNFDTLVAVVTGGGNGIGRGLALRVAELGATVAVLDVEEVAAKQVCEEITALGGSAVAIAVDVRDREAVSGAAERIFNELGKVNLLFNNAGVVVYGPLREMRPEDWDWIIAVNQFGVTNCLSAFLPGMLEQNDERHIVNTASVAGLGARNGLGAYSATKAAIVALSAALREELEPDGINVSVVCPSNVRTRIDDSDRLRDPGATVVPVRHHTRPRDLAGRSKALEPTDAAEMILRGVAAREEIILTDPSWWPLIKQRIGTIAQAMDDFDTVEKV